MDPTEYELVFHSSVISAEKAFSLVKSKRIDGFLYVAAGSGERFIEEMAPYFKENSLSFVLVHDSSCTPMDFSNVGFDSFEAARLVTDHLVGLGHRRIGFVGPVEPDVVNEVLDGYKQALANADLAFSKDDVYPLKMVYHPGGYGHPEFAFARPLEIGRMPTAFVCQSDYHALNLIKELGEQDIEVPGQVAVVSARAELTRFLSVQLGLERTVTTVKQEVVEKGQAAAQMLLDLLDDPEGGHQPQRVIIQPGLVVRQSCGSRQKREN